MTSAKLLLPCLAAFGLSALSACMESSSSGPEALDGEYFYVSDYAVSGDTLFMRTPGDTTWDCWSENPTMNIRGPETDTSRIEISGDQLTLYTSADTSRISINGVVSWAVLRRHTRYTRIGAGTGLQGRWRWVGNGHEVLSESPDGKVRANTEHYDSLNTLQLDYLTVEIRFSGGIARGRISGDYASFFLAMWNGVFALDSLDVPDSSEYAVDAVRLDSGTVRLLGRESGETVTVTFVGPRKSTHFASDRAGRAPYSQEESYDDCFIEAWYEEFLAENRRADGAFKRGIPAPDPFPGGFPGTERPGSRLNHQIYW